MRLGSPQGTFIANIAGWFAFSLLHAAGPDEAIIVGIGGLGAFTTFSASAGELLEMWTRSHMRAVVYGSLTLIAGVAGSRRLAGHLVGLTCSR